MSALSPRLSQQKRFSREGFLPLGGDQQGNMAGDATIDIPLEEVPSDGAPLKHSTTSHSQKKPMFRGRRRRPESMAQPGGVGYDGEEDAITTMGKVYKKILNFSIITRYLVYVLPLGLCIAIPIIVGATAAPGAKIGGVRIVWFFSWVEIAWCSLWVSKLVAHFLPIIFQAVVGVVNSGIRKYSLILRSLEIPLSLVGWAVTSLATFLPIMTRNPTQRSLPKTTENPNPTGAKEWESIVQKILAAAVVASLIFLGEKLIIQLISINYHRKQFSARILESKRNVYLLGQLYDASRTLFPAYCNEFAEEDYIIQNELMLMGGHSKGRSHARSGSRTPMRLLQNMGRVGDKITGAFGNIASEITGKEVFNAGSAHGIVIEALEKKRSSEALAKRIWMSFVVEGRESLIQEDLMDVLGPQRREEAEDSFIALDQDANGDISLDEMIMTVVEFSRERKAISTSMHDVDQAINVLDRLLMTVVFIAVVFVFVAFLNANFVTTLATTGTALLSLSFVFAGTCQEVLGSCIFLFVKHPYDIGDRVDIGTDQFTVEHISLLFTIMRRANGVKVGAMVQIPNITLNTLHIENLSRSKAMMEEYSVFVSFDTSFEDIQILKNELNTFVTATDNSRDFLPDVNIEVLGTTDMSKLELQVQIKHKGNWANETLRAARRSKFMCALVSALRAVPIYGPGGGGEAAGSAANPNYSVAISDALASENKKAAADTKEGKRLIPTKKIEEAKNSMSPTTSRKPGAGLSARDNKLVEDLNARDPADDAARDEVWTSARDDGSTLGRPSIDRQDLEDVRGLLRRESTRGKRKASTDPRGAYGGPSVPTINEPVSYNDYAHPSGYGSSSGTSYAQQTAYTPPNRAQSTRVPYASQLPQIQTATSPIEMSQVGRSASNPYRKRSESLTRKPLGQTAGSGSRGDDGYENTRPYSGV